MKSLPKSEPHQPCERPVAVTMMQIAARLQLSHTTVSRVLNNKPNEHVSEHVRHRVTEMAHEMGYRPNLAALSLRNARTNMVGIFTSPDPSLWGGETSEVIAALAGVLHARGLHLLFDLSAVDAIGHIALPAWRLDGAVLLQRPPAGTIDHLLRADRPFVAINEWIEGGTSVLPDGADGMRQLMDHLFELGHRSIALAGPAALQNHLHDVTERYQAYHSYLSERRIPPVTEYNQTPFASNTEASMVLPDACVDWLRRAVLGDRVTAILAYDNMVLLELLAAAQQLMLRIPKDISLACFKNDLLTMKLNPPITSVAPQTEQVGRKAGEVLLAHMDAREGAFPSSNSVHPARIRIPETLVIRESTGPVPWTRRPCH